MGKSCTDSAVRMLGGRESTLGKKLWFPSVKGEHVYMGVTQWSMVVAPIIFFRCDKQTFSRFMFPWVCCLRQGAGESDKYEALESQSTPLSSFIFVSHCCTLYPWLYLRHTSNGERQRK